MTNLLALQNWVDQVASRTQPDTIHWCTGTDSEYQQLVASMLEDGTLSSLNEEQYPNCYLHLSDPSDVARVEHLTIVCTDERGRCGPEQSLDEPGRRARKRSTHCSKAA